MRPALSVSWSPNHLSNVEMCDPGSELSKTTLFSLMLEQLQFPALNRNRNCNPPLSFKGNTRGLRLRLRKMEELGLRVQIMISTDFTEV